MKILNWEKEVKETSTDKLEQPLLTKDENGLLKVNFDPALVRLLRETRYFDLLAKDVPESALNIYSKVNFYRV